MKKRKDCRLPRNAPASRPLKRKRKAPATVVLKGTVEGYVPMKLEYPVGTCQVTLAGPKGLVRKVQEDLLFRNVLDRYTKKECRYLVRGQRVPHLVDIQAPGYVIGTDNYKLWVMAMLGKERYPVSLDMTQSVPDWVKQSPSSRPPATWLDDADGQVTRRTNDVWRVPWDAAFAMRVSQDFAQFVKKLTDSKVSLHFCRDLAFTHMLPPEGLARVHPTRLRSMAKHPALVLESPWLQGYSYVFPGTTELPTKMAAVALYTRCAGADKQCIEGNGKPFSAGLAIPPWLPRKQIIDLPELFAVDTQAFACHILTDGHLLPDKCVSLGRSTRLHARFATRLLELFGTALEGLVAWNGQADMDDASGMSDAEFIYEYEGK